MFAVVLWAGFAIGLACALTRRWYIVLTAAIALSIGSTIAAIGYLGGVAMFLLLTRPSSRAAYPPPS
jgi:hypothetical protein